jgi:hypothetical protein
MAGKTHCPECCDCIIATDDFNRDDSDDLGGNWSEESGDTDISDNEMLFVTGPAIVVLQTTHPGGANAPRRVKMRFKMPTGGGILQIFPAFTDQDDRIEAQIVTGTCDEISLVKYEAGVQTYLNPDGTSTGSQIIGDSLPRDEWHTLEVCLQPGTGYYADDGILRVKLRLASGKVYGHQYTGILAGALNVGMQGSPGIRIDDFSFEWMKDEDDPEHDRCPNCNTPCLIEGDSFTRSDSTDLGCKWTEVSGLWQIVSNELRMTSGGPGIAMCRVFHPQIKTHHYVSCLVYIDSGLQPRLLVNSNADGSECHWCQLELFGTTLRLTIGKNGSSIEVAEAPSGAGFHQVTLCYDGSSVTATSTTVTFPDTPILKPTAISQVVDDGIYAGVSGRSSGGERFDNFSFQKHQSFTDPEDRACPNCPEGSDCDSEACDNDNIPPGEFGLDLGTWGLGIATACNDFTGNEFECSPCTNVGGMYIVTAAPNPVAIRTGCYWKYDTDVDDACVSTTGHPTSPHPWEETISLELFDNGDGTHTWVALVNLCLSTGTTDTAPCFVGTVCRTVLYRSAPQTNGPCISNLPLVLNLVDDGTTPAGEDHVVCTGDAPLTIALREL